MIASLRSVYERLKALDKACGTNTIRSSDQCSNTPVSLPWKGITVYSKEERVSLDGRNPPAAVCVYDKKLFLRFGETIKIFLACTEGDATTLLSNIDNMDGWRFIERDGDESLKITDKNGICVEFQKYRGFLIGCQYRLNVNSSYDVCNIIFNNDNNFQMDLQKLVKRKAKWKHYIGTCCYDIIKKLPNCCPDIGGESTLIVKEEVMFSCNDPEFDFSIDTTDTKA